MKVNYIIGAKNNPLYDNNFMNNGKYQTFGHHSFCYDLVMDLARKNYLVAVLTDDMNSFPLVDVFSQNGITVKNVHSAGDIKSEIVIIDSVPDTVLSAVKISGLKIGIIHDYMKYESSQFYLFCDRIICLTDAAQTRQSAVVDPEKIVVITQGIDLSRFTMDQARSQPRTALIYSRMDAHKGSIYIPIIERLIENGFSVNVLGAGMYFDQIGTKFADAIISHQHIPCYKIHTFVARFDLVVSNGRGVMEGMASGKPTIAAGVRYCGLLDSDNIEFFFQRNFTGSNSTRTVEQINDDLLRLSHYDSGYFRRLAEKYFDVSVFTSKLLELSPHQSP